MSRREEILNALEEITPAEKFYRDYYRAKSSGNADTLQEFLQEYTAEDLIRQKFLCPDLYDPYELFYEKRPNRLTLDEHAYFPMSLSHNIRVEKHNRYTPFYLHGHDYFEAFYVLRGQCRHFIDDEETTLSRGQLCFIAPHTFHGLSVFDDSLVLNILIQRTTFDDIFFNVLRNRNILSDFFLSNLFSSSNVSHMLFNARDPELEGLLLDMLAEEAQPDEYTNRILNSLMIVFFTKLIRSCSGSARLYHIHSSWSSLDSEMLTYINENYKNVSLVSLADHMGYAPEHCSRLLKKATGKTFTTILKDIRMRRAETLLITTDLSVNEISTACGFEYTSTFIKLFRKQHDMAPGQYRQEVRSQRPS